MTRNERRLDRVAERLTAKERALLVLRAMKEEKPPDPAWRRTMPEDQVEEFHRYLALIEGVNLRLGWYLLVLYQGVEKLGLRMESIINQVLWGFSCWQTRLFMMDQTKEPVTESVYRELEVQARAGLMPVDELADLLVEEGQEPEAVRDEAWERLRREKEDELAALVEQGVLAGSETGAGLFVQAGSFYDWHGEPVPMHPAWAGEYEVIPDDEAEQFHDRREGRLALRDIPEAGPMLETARLLGIDEHLAELAAPTPADAQLEHNVKFARANIVEYWRRLGAIGQIAEEVRHELDGEDPLVPFMREMVDESRADLNLWKRLAPLIGPLELEEPREEDLAWVRGLMATG